MVFECPLDGLVEEVGGEEFVYICTWEPSSEWLVLMVNTYSKQVVAQNLRGSQGQSHGQTIGCLHLLSQGVSRIVQVCKIWQVSNQGLQDWHCS